MFGIVKAVIRDSIKYFLFKNILKLNFLFFKVIFYCSNGDYLKCFSLKNYKFIFIFLKLFLILVYQNGLKT
jgi:hypothetical protein